jgi:probable rRNA maturation factor
MINTLKPMDNAIEVVIECDLWNDFELAEIATQTFDKVVAGLQMPKGPYEISILACDDARIAVLNTEFRGKETATNVLSWPSYDLQSEEEGQSPETPPPAKSGDPYVSIGDIAIAYETCMQEASEGGIEPVHHITHLLMHGMLHLLGYDHETDADAELMENLETDLLARMGIGNPYQNV